MNILVLNCGSSSVKFQLIETSPEQMAAHSDRVLARGAVERVGEPESLLTARRGTSAPEKRGVRAENYRGALDEVFTWMASAGVMRHADEIQAVGHRFVHGGHYFEHSVTIDDTTLPRIRASSELAPLHNPHNLEAYRASRIHLPQAIHVAVFDTAFHQTMPPRAYLYGLPWAWYQEGHIRRYGFHGTSHRYVMQRFAELKHKSREAFNLITCHLGNGSSVCAIEHGKSVDTSMGLTPLEGLLMGSRVGDLDPGALLYILKLFSLSPQDAEGILNEKSGVLALSGVSEDMREILKAAQQGHARARIAIEAFCYRVAKYIGAYFLALGGVDGVIFTGGIGEHSPEIRRNICQFLMPLGVELNDDANSDAEREISRQNSRLAAWVIPTDEELLIAHDTVRCVLGIPCT
ncbi:MAG: acetate/propionate family kinase [Terriglobia bacterium]